MSYQDGVATRGVGTGQSRKITKNHKESFFFFVILCDRS